MPERPIIVLLPVYNGAAYLEPQLQSLFGQSHSAVWVLCRDDGSSDASPQLLEQASQRWPGRMRIVHDGLGNLGASGSFARLLELAVQPGWSDTLGPPGLPPYLALCDQDDIWHTDKLATCAQLLQALENEHPGRPALVHSDLRVVTDEGLEIAPSMARYQGLRTQHQSLAAQLLSNTLTGCTSLMNRALVQACLPIPPAAIMHDWWLSLVASAWGVRRYIDQALIDYRQHSRNAIGAKAHDQAPLRGTFFQRLFDNRHADIFRLNARQAAAFAERYQGRLSGRQRLILAMVQSLAIPVPPWQRVVYTVLRRL